MNNLSAIAPVRLSKIVQYIIDQRELPGNLLWLNRLPETPVNDKELFARYISRVKIGDLIPMNAEARTYKSGHMKFEASELAIIKFGTDWDQEQIADIASWAAVNGGIPGADVLTNFLSRNADNLVLGTRQRQNYMATGMMLDGFTYHDPNGVQVNIDSFGMPADLKVLVSTFWTDHSSSTPIGDILQHRYKMQMRYGIRYNRLTMSEALFREVIANANYLDLSKPYMPINISAATNIPTTDIPFHLNLFNRITGMSVEFDDTLYWDQRPDGTWYSFRNHPLNRVIFSDSAMDNSTMLGDLGNGIVDESRVQGLLSSNGGSTPLGGPIPSNVRGPLSYATGSLNPPAVQQWIVAKCWPRKGLLFSSSVMKAAADSFTDSVSYISPF